MMKSAPYSFQICTTVNNLGTKVLPSSNRNPEERQYICFIYRFILLDWISFFCDKPKFCLSWPTGQGVVKSARESTHSTQDYEYA